MKYMIDIAVALGAESAAASEQMQEVMDFETAIAGVSYSVLKILYSVSWCGGFNFPPCSVFRITKYGYITSCDACAQQSKIVAWVSLGHPCLYSPVAVMPASTSTTSGERVDRYERQNFIFLLK